MPVGARPLAVRDHKMLTIPTEHLFSRSTRWSTIDKRQSPFEWRAGLVLGEPVEAREGSATKPNVFEENNR
jgi:hypothetical protein